MIWTYNCNLTAKLVLDLTHLNRIRSVVIDDRVELYKDCEFKAHADRERDLRLIPILAVSPTGCDVDGLANCGLYCGSAGVRHRNRKARFDAFA